MLKSIFDEAGKLLLTAKRPALYGSFRISSDLTFKERCALYDLAASKAPGSVAEIGSYLGASAAALAIALRKSGSEDVVFCIDTWENDAMSEGRQDTLARFESNTKSFEKWLIPVRGRSVDVVVQIQRQTSGLSVLFVDGDHSYEGCLADWQSYEPLLNDGALVIFHDVGWAEGVQRVVEEEVRPRICREGGLPNMWWGWLA